MDRADAAGLSAAALGHIALFGLLSLSLIRKPPPPPTIDPVEVQLVDDVGLRSAQPKANETPAPSFAPEVAPPEPPVAEPIAQPIAKAKPDPKPAPEPASKPAPTPASKPAPTSAAVKPKPSHLATDLALATSTTLPSARPKGARLSSAFLEGVSDKPSVSTNKTPKATTIDAKAIASISDALRRQVQPCADRALNPGPGASGITTKLNLHFNKDGSFTAQPSMLAQSGIDDDNRRYAQRVKELAIAAYVQCAPYHLPPELYADSANRGWNNITATFTLRAQGQ